MSCNFSLTRWYLSNTCFQSLTSNGKGARTTISPAVVARNKKLENRMRCHCIEMFLTHFLQEYFGLTPKLETAFFNGLPGLKFFFFPPYVSTVIRSEVSDMFRLEPRTGWKAAVEATIARKARIKVTSFMVCLSVCCNLVKRRCVV